MSEPKKKRQRVTIVCSNCKKRKVKCDRGKPCCQNCTKANVPHLCFYETPGWATTSAKLNEPSKPIEIQDIDDVPNHPSTSSQGDDVKSLEEEARCLEAELEKLVSELKSKNKTVEEDFSDCASDLAINFYEGYNSLTFRKSFANDQKPFSDSALLLKDSYLRISMFATFFNFKPKKGDFATFMMKYKGVSLKVLKKGMLFDPKIGPMMFQGNANLANIEEKIEDDVLRMFQKMIKGKEESDRLKEAFLPSLFGGEENGDVAGIIKLIEELLPNTTVFDKYMDYFKSTVHPCFPIVNQDFFLRLRTGPLKEIDHTTNRFKVNCGNDWKQLILLATALVILRLSYIAFDVDPTKSEDEAAFLEQFPIPIEIITVCARCLGYINIFKRINEDVLVCLLYIRTYMTFSPEDSDMASKSSMDIMLNVIVYCALHIGLYRDPTEYSQFKNNKEIITFRRRLWMLIVHITRVDVVCNGGIPQLKGEYLMPDSVMADITDDEPLYIMCSQLDILKKLAKMDILSTRVHTKTKLNDIRIMMRSLEADLQKKVPLNIMKEHKGDTAISIRNIHSSRMNLLGSLHLASVNASLACHFEIMEENTDPILFKEFFFKSMDYAMELVAIVILTLDGSNDKYIDPKMGFLQLKLTLYAYSKGSYLLLSCLLRCLHTISLLNVRKQRNIAYPSIVNETDEKIQILKSVVMQVIELMSHLNKLGREKLAMRYYSSHKLIFWFEQMLTSIKERGVAFIIDFLNKMETNPPAVADFKKFMISSGGYDINSFSKSDLDGRNSMMFFGIDDYKTIWSIFNSKALNVPECTDTFIQVFGEPIDLSTGMTPLHQESDTFDAMDFPFDMNILYNFNGFDWINQISGISNGVNSEQQSPTHFGEGV